MKKKIPLSLIEVMKPLSDEYKHLIEPIENDDIIYGVKDSDKESPFFFKVERQDSKGDTRFQYTIHFMPRSKSVTTKHKTRLDLSKLKNQYKQWLLILSQYEKTKTIYDDPIIKKYTDEFQTEYEIIDENAATEPFNLKQQIYLDDYLSKSEEKILLLKEGKSEEEKNNLDKLIDEIHSVKDAISKESKKDVIKRLSIFWAKARKLGLDILKEVFIDFTTELTKKLITGS